MVSMVELPNLQDRPALFSTFLMWLLADLFHDLPEVGDAEKPKLVFFFDEAHLLFDDASKAFLDQIAQTVRLIRSKGVGVFFVTQSPTDVPDDVLAQLGSRVQHQLRAATPNDAKALKQTVNTYPTSSYDDLGKVILSLGIGEAIVTVMNERGAPTPVAWTRLRAPESLMGPADAAAMDAAVKASPGWATYSQVVDRESASEKLAARMQAGAEKQAQEQAAQGRHLQARAQAEGGQAPGQHLREGREVQHLQVRREVRRPRGRARDVRGRPPLVRDSAGTCVTPRPVRSCAWGRSIARCQTHDPDQPGGRTRPSPVSSFLLGQRDLPPVGRVDRREARGRARGGRGRRGVSSPVESSLHIPRGRSRRTRAAPEPSYARSPAAESPWAVGSPRRLPPCQLDDLDAAVAGDQPTPARPAPAPAGRCRSGGPRRGCPTAGVPGIARSRSDWMTGS